MDLSEGETDSSVLSSSANYSLISSPQLVTQLISALLNSKSSLNKLFLFAAMPIRSNHRCQSISHSPASPSLIDMAGFQEDIGARREFAKCSDSAVPMLTL
jgi:hypothetical protein